MDATNLSPFVDVNKKVAKLSVVFVDQFDPFWTDFLEGHHGGADDQRRPVAQQLFDDPDQLLFLQKIQHIEKLDLEAHSLKSLVF